MSDFRGERFPVGALWGAGALITVTLLTVGGMQAGVIPKPLTVPQKRAQQHVPVLVSHDFTFTDRKDGALVVGDPATGGTAMILEPGSNSGFIRGVMRGLMRERMLHEVSRTAPVTVTQWGDGALTLEDKSTGRIIELGSFGQTNRAAFAQLLVPYGGARASAPQIAASEARRPG